MNRLNGVHEPKKLVSVTKRWCVAALGILLGCMVTLVPATNAYAEEPFVVTHTVTDHSGVLEVGAIETLENSLKDLSQETGIELYVVYVASVDGLPAEEWAAKTGTLSGLRGDRPALMVVATDDHFVGIAYSIGFPILTADVNRIIHDIGVPAMTTTEKDWLAVGTGMVNGMKDQAISQGIKPVETEKQDTSGLDDSQSSKPGTDVTTNAVTSPTGGISNSTWVILIIGGLLVVAAVIVAIMITRKKILRNSAVEPPLALVEQAPEQSTFAPSVQRQIQNPMDRIVEQTSSTPSQPLPPPFPATAFDLPPKRASVSETVRSSEGPERSRAEDLVTTSSFQPASEESVNGAPNEDSAAPEQSTAPVRATTRRLENPPTPTVYSSPTVSEPDAKTRWVQSADEQIDVFGTSDQPTEAIPRVARTSSIPERVLRMDRIEHETEEIRVAAPVRSREPVQSRLPALVKTEHSLARSKNEPITAEIEAVQPVPTLPLEQALPSKPAEQDLAVQTIRHLDNGMVNDDLFDLAPELKYPQDRYTGGQTANPLRETRSKIAAEGHSAEDSPRGE